MGWQNPPIPWHELERRLSGRPAPTHRPAGDGGDSPAWSRKRPAYQPAPVARPASPVRFAELHAHSSFSFLDGASSPEELVEEAVRLGLSALTLTDHDGMYGIVRFAEAAEALGLPTAFGAELSLDSGGPPANEGGGPPANAGVAGGGVANGGPPGIEGVAAGGGGVANGGPPGIEGVAAGGGGVANGGPPGIEGVAAGGGGVAAGGGRVAAGGGGEMPATKAERMIAARVGTADPPGRHLLALARDPTGYASLCRVISKAQLRGGAKGRPVYDLDELAEVSDGHWLVLTGCRKGAVRQALEAQRGTFALDPARQALGELVERFGRDNVAVELTYELDPLADDRYEALAALADEAGLAIVATTAAHYHAPVRRPLATAMAAVRARSSLDELDGWLPAWAGQHLRSGGEMAQRFARWPGAVENAERLGKELAFPLTLIAPDLPPFPVPPGHTEMTYLRELTYAGAAERFRGKAHEATAYRQIEHELTVIEELHFPGYFLVVWDIARFCRSKKILCQGRGSAANSAVCYALKITAVDAVDYKLMFERFLAPERGEPPDIDIDIESDRREEVIQYVYELHGREHAAQVANVITYRPKSAVRDIAKALGYSPGQQDAWSKEIERGYYWSSDRKQDGRTTDDDLSEVPPLVVSLAAELQNAPRHLGIHSGGMVMCDRPVIEVCPVEWGRLMTRSASGARKPSRTVLQWDKDDCAAIGLVKFDLLGLGMLSALQYCFELIESWHGISYDLDSIPKEQVCVYDMLCAADSIGVFQVESRAQMATLPRLRPRNFYDLAIEIALIRPGPIQGDSVHPYIRRRHGEEPITYPHPRLEEPLKRTLGIPLFQEQLMQLTVAVADFSPSEADQLRRAMGSKRSRDKIETMRIRLYDGMATNGITGAVADNIYEKIQAFAAFGFAESHSISFALLVYASSWLKRHYPAAFLAALLNAQPMGFYSPQSLVHDAKRHGIEVRPPSLGVSAATASLEAGDSKSQCPCLDAEQPAVRLGLGSVRTIGTDLAERIVAERASAPFTSMADLARRVGLSADQLEALATSGAFDCFSFARRTALWAAGAAASARPGQLAVVTFDESAVPALPPMTEPEQLIADMWATGITTDCYPTALIRDRLDALGIITSAGLRSLEDHTRVTVGGVVTHRQRPATARGVTFLNLEDETGMVNVIVDEVVWGRHRRVAREAGGLLIRGMLERTGDVINVLAERIEKLNLGLRTTSRDFR